MKKKEPCSYIIWFICSGLWAIIFCRSLLYGSTSGFITFVQFLNMCGFFASGVLNAKGYKQRNSDEEE